MKLKSIFILLSGCEILKLEYEQGNDCAQIEELQENSAVYFYPWIATSHVQTK
jgi:hypothetical protein